MSDGSWSNQAISLIVLTEETAGFSGIFGYSPSPGTGNLVFSVSAAQGTDPYGNTYPAGLSGEGALSISGTVASVRIYSSVPAKGDLIGSWSGTATTDAFGNAIPQGLNVTVGAITGTTFTGGTVNASSINGAAINTATFTGGQISASNITGGTISASVFQGTDFTINSDGMFVYVP